MADKLVIDASGEGNPPQWVPLTPEEEAQMAADGAEHAKREQGVAFAGQEDAERLAVVNERAQTDPAFAALAELALRGKGV